ncbi:GPP34 family phosphoprotein [Nonomuraea glycinis]|uniref:GPP34 family phosphoprotein n=1 Tax=Nonomuraea glycinis TaxID=2047744 RepID=UPI0033B68B92
MRKFRIRLGLTLFALAGVVAGIAWALEAFVSALILYAIAAFLAWQGVMAFLGRIKPPQRPARALHTLAESAEYEKASDVLSSPSVDSGDGAGTDHLDVLKATGEVVKDTASFLRRFITVLLLLVLVPAMLMFSVGGVYLLSQGTVLGAGGFFLVAGGIAWCCWGPLRVLWEGDGGEKSPVTEDHTKTENDVESGSAVLMSPSVQLSLPEEIVLLSYRYGAAHDDERSAIACAGAEIGELTLRRRVQVVGRKHKFLGAEVYLWSGAIRVVDSTLTGLAWADELLAELERRGRSRWRLVLFDTRRTSSESGAVGLDKWLGLRGGEALLLHRDALTERGVLFRSPGFRPGQEERHYPDPSVRNELISQLRAVHYGRVPMDEHMLLLLNLLEKAGLNDELGLISRASRRFGSVHGDGEPEAVSEEVRDISEMLSVSISRQRGGEGGSGGGDGGE